MADYRVLVCDDSIMMRSMIKTVLEEDERLSFSVVGEAADGTSALEEYKKTSPDLVTMDVVMPRAHGIDAIRSIIDHDPSARIIIISGLHQKQLIMEALEAGAKDYVVKPFTDDELRAAVHKLVE